MVNQELVRSIASEAVDGLFEGGAGSGHYGHKGRPGKRGGSLPGGGGGGGAAAHKVSGKASGGALRGMKKGDTIRITNPVTGWKSLHSADKLKPSKSIKGGVVITSKEKTLSGLVGMPVTHTLIVKPQDKVEIFRGGKKVGTSEGSGDAKTYYAAKGKGISAHKISVGGQRIHAKNFYTVTGKLDTANYRKLSDANKTQILKHGLQKYSELYIPKANQGKLSAERLEINKKVGALEGMRRAALSKTKGLEAGSKEWRAATHVAISLQERADTLYHFSGSKSKG